MDKPRQQDPLFTVKKNGDKASTPQKQMPAVEFKAPFSVVPSVDDNNSPLTAARHDNKPVSQKPAQDAHQNDSKKGK